MVSLTQTTALTLLLAFLGASIISTLAASYKTADMGGVCSYKGSDSDEEDSERESDDDTPNTPKKPDDDAAADLLALQALRFADDLVGEAAPAAWGWVLDFSLTSYLNPHLEGVLAWFRVSKGWNGADLEALALSIVSLLPKFMCPAQARSIPSQGETPLRQLLAQAEAIVHKPVGFASSPSLPGTISSPWWTDFAHLIYWFYFIATFATVAFLWYLYDFRVRRVETAHPIRETRGFSRAQTGDLVTAVLPLTWSATMVMHASTHSINFDENTAGTAFSFTVIAYQWGWNYYFPRDIITQLEAAPKVVGRGRVVAFETTPMENLPASQWDSWALRATIGSRHGSRNGRLNASPALSLILPTDVPAGYFSSVPLSTGMGWRKALFAALNEVSVAPFNPALPQPNEKACVTRYSGLEAPTLFRAKPSAYISGSRIVLTYRHQAFNPRPVPFAACSWITANISFPDGSDAQTRATRSLLSTPAAPALPGLENLSGAAKDKLDLLLVTPKGLGLENLRSPASPSQQHLLWTGPDAVTGAGNLAIGSTEDHGWISPVTARESCLRSALATKASALFHLKSNAGLPLSRASAAAALLLPFDLNARYLINHNLPLSASLPFTWAVASAALESDIETASSDLWATALLPDQSQAALAQPLTLISSQSTSSCVRSLLAPLSKGLKPFNVAPVAAALPKAHAKPQTPPTLVAYLTRPRPAAFGLPSSNALAAPFGALVNVRQPLPSGRHTAVFGLVTGQAFVLPPQGRVKFTPSSIGLGLDESRLVRTGASRLADSAILSNKLEGLASPSLTLPSLPLAVLGLGWSTSASLTSYPSYKVSRGGLFRRPFTGLSSQPKPLEGLKEPFSLLNLAKNTTHLGLASLTLINPSTPKFYAAAPSLDNQIGAWASVWATLTPAPTEDLDPTFINASWTPEINTTRRSDHNSRYLVSWSPILSSLTAGASVNPTLSGPGARAAHNPAMLRSSALALNELGLRNSSGVRNVKPILLQSESPAETRALAFGMAPSSSAAKAPSSPKWVSLWGSLPYPSTNPFVSSATQLTPDKLSGRSATLLTRRGGLLKGGALTSVSNHLGGGDKVNPLVDALAKLEFSNLSSFGLEVRPRQGYLPLNSDISASRRLRVTKGVTLPSDTPMHVICGSKDVIHSWAIPGLNVKIDCIPGYNSHRRLLLRWRGAYWGQCMEVCGRYHHWMPIMVNVVHPALFVDWCLTFLRGLDTQSANGPTTLPPLDLEALLKAFA